MLKEKGFKKGINLGGWFSQCDYSEKTMNEFITESDFEKIASWGIDHIRLPVDYNVFENNDGSYIESGFERISDVLSLCKKYSLKTIIDLHKTYGYSFDNYGESESGFFDSEQLQERFYRLWEEFAKRYGCYSDRVAFELLNEVTEKDYIDAWNRISYTCIERIRRYAPETIILVGSYDNNSSEAVPELAKPYDDKIVYNFHCYEPLIFTHQGAYWAEKINPDKRISFDESNITPEYFEKLFKPAIESAKKYNTGLYCGEYGVINIVSPEDTLKWYKCINSIFEKYDIPRSAWCYKSLDFGISDAHLDNICETLLKYL